MGNVFCFPDAMLHRLPFAMQIAQTRSGSALLDLVALVMAESRVLCWAEGVASACRHAFVTLSDLSAVLIVSLTTAAEEHRRFDSCSTHLHGWCSWIANMLGCECLAFVQRGFACTVSQHRGVFDVNFLIDVQLRLQVCRKCGCSKQCEAESTELHCTNIVANDGRRHNNQ